ncbi:MAG: hypothetical protein ACOZCO_10665 [Bacteroidota bacterium]
MNKKPQPTVQNKEATINDKEIATPNKKKTFFSDRYAIYLIGGRFPSFCFWRRKN